MEERKEGKVGEGYLHKPRPVNHFGKTFWSRGSEVCLTLISLFSLLQITSLKRNKIGFPHTLLGSFRI